MYPKQLKVLTFNIHHGVGMDGRLDIERIARILKESQADIIGLNEVDCFFSKRSCYLNQVKYLADSLQMYFAFGPAISLKNRKSTRLRQFGNTLLSRYPIFQQKNHRLVGGLIEGRALLETTIRIHDRSLQVFITHLSLNPYLHRKQISYIFKQLSNTLHPAILLGDLNMKPGSRAWHQINRVFKDVCPTPLLTFPSHYPMVQLDYIFISPSLQATSVQTINHEARASDHLPLFATLNFP